MIMVISRAQPATRDPVELNHRHAQIGVLEHRAKRLFCNYTTWGEIGAAQIKVVARTNGELGKLFRFLVEADLSHQTSLLYVETETLEEREIVQGLGMPDLVFAERPY